MRRRLRTGEDGQATVEFAMVLPIVLLVVVGGIQFGLAFTFWLDLNHVASQSARWTSVNRLPSTSSLPTGSSAVTPTQVRQYVESQVLSKGLLDSIAAENEVQTITLGGGSGQFRLSYAGSAQTPNINSNASAASVQTALRALPTINGPNVNVTGPSGGPYVVTFVGTLAEQDVAAIAATTTGTLTATVTETTPGSGIEACYSKGPNNTLSTPQPGDALEITISAPYHLGFGLAEWAVSPLTLRGRSTMRIEQAPSGSGWTQCA